MDRYIVPETKRVTIITEYIDGTVTTESLDFGGKTIELTIGEYNDDDVS